MARTILPTFGKGELSPELHGRVDTAAYAAGLATARNMIVHTYGGASRRPGTRFIGPVADHDYAPRLIPFQFKTTDQYILEFGNQYMRVIRNDGHVTLPEVNITAVTNTVPAIVTAVAHGFSNGDEVAIVGVQGMTQLNGNRYYVDGVTANTFQLKNQIDNTDIDATAYGVYTSGGTVAKIFQLTTPYSISDIYELRYTQSADVMTITHNGYPPKELRRTDHNAWTLDDLAIGPVISAPTGVSVTVNTVGVQTARYKVTAIDRETYVESLSGLNSTVRSITAITQANPCVVTTSVNHGFSTGDEVYMNSIGGMIELEDRRFLAVVITPTTFSLKDLEGTPIDSTAFTAFTAGGNVRQTFVRVTNSNGNEDNTIAWTAVAGAERYAVYREDNGVFGLLGETERVTFEDDNLVPNTDITPPVFRTPFQEDEDYPGAVGYFEQRRVFGGSLAKPDTSEFSAIGDQNNFNRNLPVEDDDAITVTLASAQVNEIRHYVPLNDLVVMTSGAEWKINSGPNQNFTPSSVRQRIQSYWGSSFLTPIVLGNTVLFVTDDYGNVRSLGYSLELDGYTGSNLNVLSRHLVEGYEINSWCHVRNPDSRIYLARSDGMGLSLSFDQEQEVVAWTRFDTSGDFEEVMSLRGGGVFGEDTVYWVVRRTVNGRSVRYIEVMRQTVFDDVRDCFFVDSGLSLDNPLPITDVSLTNPVVITSAGHGLSNGDEVDIFGIKWIPSVDSYGNETQPSQLNTMRYVVQNVTANTFEVAVDGTAFNAYDSGGTVREAVITVGGLDHLEGRSVVCLCDGNVVTGQTVVDGRVTFARKFSRIHVGLPYTSDLETLGVEASQGTTLQGLKKKINKVVIRLFKSRGMLVGPDKDNLTEMKFRQTELLGDPTDLVTGDKEIWISQTWSPAGRVFIRSIYPLPMTILAIVPVLSAENEDAE